MALTSRSVSSVVRAPDPPASGTSLVVATGHAAKFAAGTAHLHPAGVTVTAGNTEIVTVTPLMGDVLTIVRAQSGSTAYAVRAGDVISQGIQVADWDSLPVPGSVSTDVIEAAAEVSSTYAPVSSEPTAITYNGDGTVNTVTETVSGAVTTYTYNGDGTPATESRVLSGVTVTRTFSYSGGNLVGVA